MMSAKAVWGVFLVVNLVATIVLFFTSFLLDEKTNVALAQAMIIFIALLLVESQVVPGVSLLEQKRLIVREAEAIKSRTSDLKRKAEHEIFAVWCFSTWSYNADLREYFREEVALLEKGISIERIIDARCAGRDAVRKHCNETKVFLLNGTYRLSLNDPPEEFVIVDKESILLYAEASTGYGLGMAVGPLGTAPEDKAWVLSHIKQFRDLFDNGQVLHVAEATFDHDVDTWLETYFATH